MFGGGCAALYYFYFLGRHHLLLPPNQIRHERDGFVGKGIAYLRERKIGKRWVRVMR